MKFWFNFMEIITARVRKITMGGQCTFSIMKCDWLLASRGPITLHD